MSGSEEGGGGWGKGRGWGVGEGERVGGWMMLHVVRGVNFLVDLTSASSGSAEN